jgi:RNA recognition motif-containing protein
MALCSSRQKCWVTGPSVLILLRKHWVTQNFLFTERGGVCYHRVASWITSGSCLAKSPNTEYRHARMSFTVFLGNLPVWVTKDDIKSWLNAENLVYDDVKVIRNPETQESKGFAFIDTPNAEEMNSIIRRFDRAPLEDRLLRANQAQPPKSKGPGVGPPGPVNRTPTGPRRERGGRKHKRPGNQNGPQGPASAFAEELAKAL